MKEDSAKIEIARPALVADIGGTNARFATVDRHGSLGPATVIPIAASAGFDEALQRLVLPNMSERPRSAVLALAATIQGDRANLTNGHWSVRPTRLIEDFGLSEVILLNDFEALALALPNLPVEAIRPIGGTQPPAAGTKLVVGAGTGLGAAALLRSGDKWLPVPGESGHVSFGAATPMDTDIWRVIGENENRISAETILSGAGIRRLHHALASIAGGQTSYTEAADIVSLGLADRNGIAAEALQLFTSYLGRFAGDLALVFLARGGVFVAGGIAPRIADMFEGGWFRDAFVEKTPFEALLSSIPISLIIHPTPALLGLRDFINNPSAFAVDLTGRRWR